jgi:hypothetical protein
MKPLTLNPDLSNGCKDTIKFMLVDSKRTLVGKYVIAIHLRYAQPAPTVARALTSQVDQLALVASGLPDLYSCATSVVQELGGGSHSKIPSHMSSTAPSRSARSPVRDTAAPRLVVADTSFSPLPCLASYGYMVTSAHRVEVEVTADGPASAPPPGPPPLRRRRAPVYYYSESKIFGQKATYKSFPRIY